MRTEDARDKRHTLLTFTAITSLRTHGSLLWKAMMGMMRVVKDW